MSSLSTFSARAVVAAGCITLMTTALPVAHAQDEAPTGFNRGINIVEDFIAKPSGLVPGETKPADLIFDIINWLLGLVAVVALAVLIWGSFKYITSLGDEKKTGEAKRIILFAIVGVLLVALSFLIISTIETLFLPA